MITELVLALDRQCYPFHHKSHDWWKKNKAIPQIRVSFPSVLILMGIRKDTRSLILRGSLIQWVENGPRENQMTDLHGNTTIKAFKWSSSSGSSKQRLLITQVYIFTASTRAYSEHCSLHTLSFQTLNELLQLQPQLKHYSLHPENTLCTINSATKSTCSVHNN